MPVELAHGVLGALGAYLSIGLVVGISFVIAGIGQVDAAAKDTPWTFKLVVLPGVVALWPFVAARWVGARRRR